MLERRPIEETKRLVRRRIREIKVCVAAKDYERATILERELYDAALQEVAENRVCDPEAVARAVLETKKIKFPRLAG